ncbi:MAG: hypothetical protein WCK51_01535 [Armatimonadota bacterium]
MARSQYFRVTEPHIPTYGVSPILSPPRRLVLEPVADAVGQGPLWITGNEKLLGQGIKRAMLDFRSREPDIESIRRESEQLVLDGFTLVCGIHSEAHREMATMPLKWGASRILVLAGGLRFHLGEHLNREPFTLARWWRYEFDPTTDLAISLAPGLDDPAPATRVRLVEQVIKLLGES